MAPENIIQTGRECFNFGVQYVLIFSIFINVYCTIFILYQINALLETIYVEIKFI